jgi:hypothetical protein
MPAKQFSAHTPLIASTSELFPARDNITFMLNGLRMIDAPDWPPMTAIEGKSINPPAL